MMTESLIITVPDLGGAEQVDVIEVLVKEGDDIDTEQSVITIETDKASMEIPAGQSGRVKKVLLKLGDKVSMGDAMLEIEASGNQTEFEESADAESADSESADSESADADAVDSKESISDKITLESSHLESSHLESSHIESSHIESSAVDKSSSVDINENVAPPIQSTNMTDEAHAGPAVRLLVRELGIDLSKVKGTGIRERITRDDVQNYVKAMLKNSTDSSLFSISEGNETNANQTTTEIPKVPDIDFSKFGEIEHQPLNKIKLATAKNMTTAWLNVPQVTQFDQVNITELEDFRQQVNKNTDGLKLSIVPFVMKALAAAMKEFPQFNASLSADGQSLIYKKYINIGVAVDTPNGLLVPVIRDVDKKSVTEIAADLFDKAEKSRLGKLGLADMQGGCISVSSLGGIGGTAFTPIVNAPEVAILGLSRAELKPLWQASNNDSGEFVPALMLPLSLSYDHRVVDGAEAARFSQYLVAILSDIRRLVL